MNPLRKLIEMFSELPGIGPRHARRMAHYLLTQDDRFLRDLSESISTLKNTVKTCASCFRYFENGNNHEVCSICRNTNRDSSMRMIVAFDADLENMEKTENFNGLYFVLGGLIPLLDPEPSTHIRERELFTLISKDLKEIIFALNATPEGENTYLYLKEKFEQRIRSKIKISSLGRGLSTGSELEYSDKETLRNALKTRQ